MIDKLCCQGDEKKIEECKKHNPYCQSGGYECPFFSDVELHVLDYEIEQELRR